jgi:hypothetical protein
MTWQLVLLVIASLDRGYGMVLINGVMQIVIATVASTTVAGYVLLYFVLATAAVVIHNNQVAVREAAVDAAVHLGVSLRRALGASLLVVLVLSAIVPFFPELRTNFLISLGQVSRQKPIDAIDYLLSGVLVATALVIVMQLIGQLIERLRRQRSTTRPAASEVEDLLAPELPSVPLSTRLLQLFPTPRERVVEEYLVLLRQLGHYGYPRPAAMTAREYAARIADRQADAAPPLRELTELFCHVRYDEARVVDRADVATAHRLSRDVIEQMRP